MAIKSTTKSSKGFVVTHIDGREGFFKSHVGRYTTLEAAVRARNAFFGKYRKINGSSLAEFLSDERLTGKEMMLNDGYNAAVITRG